MSHQFWGKFGIMAIAISFSLSGQAIAQVQSNISAETNIHLSDRLSSPWENAVLIHTLKSSSQINKIKFSPNGKILASVESKQITLWQTESGAIERILPGHYSSENELQIPPTAIAFSPDNNFLATATWSQGLLIPDQSLIVWDLNTGEKILEFDELAGCQQVVFDPTSTILYGACGSGITAWNFPEGNLLYRFNTESSVEKMALAPDGKTMATVNTHLSKSEKQTKKPHDQPPNMAHQIQLWSLNETEAKLINRLNGHANDIAQIEFTADGKKLVSSSYDGKIKVWNWQTGMIDSKMNSLYSKNGLFSLSANSHLIAGNFHSSAITSLITGLPLRNVLTISHKQAAKMLAFSPQGQLLARVNQIEDNEQQQINLWQNDPEQQLLQSAATEEDQYVALDLAEYWTNQKENHHQKPSAIGQDPQAISLAALSLTEIIESEQETVELNYADHNSALVTITQTNLPDDSIAGIRYLIKFMPYGAHQAKLWQVIWAGKQFKCHVGRGHTNWNKDICH